MTRAFMPLLHAGREACLVNLSSVSGLVSPPGRTAHATSKFAVRGFSNALRYELAGAGVFVVHPYGVATAIAGSARIQAVTPPEQAEQACQATKRILTLSPALASEIIVRGVEWWRARILVGRDAKITSWFERVAPVSHWIRLKRLIGGRRNRLGCRYLLALL